MANWEAINRDIGGIGTALADQSRQEMTRHRDFEDAINLMKAKAQVEMQIKNQDPIAQFLKKAEIARSIKDMSEAGMDVSGYQGMFGGGAQTQDLGFTPEVPQADVGGGRNLVASEYTQTPFGEFKPGKFTDINAVTEIERQKELAKGVPAAESGKVALARESLRNIETVKKTLFPSGKAKSFQRMKAFGSNLPLNYVPGLPQRMPFDKDAQDIYRQMGSALAGRQLIQTGTAAKESETARLINQYAPNLFSADESAMQGLNELQDFYKTYLYIVETKGLQAADEWASFQSSPGNVIGANQPQQKEYIKTGIDQDTKKRVGMLPDGTIEEIK